MQLYIIIANSSLGGLSILADMHSFKKNLIFVLAFRKTKLYNYAI
jgi:hypothetical protein